MKPPHIISPAVEEDTLSPPVAWLAIFVAILTLSTFTGCAFYEAHKDQFAATGELIAKRVAGIAGRVILNAAVGELTGSDADFLDSVATGLQKAAAEDRKP